MEKDSQSASSVTNSGIPSYNENQQQLFQQKTVLEKKYRRSINWFYWIAGLSVVNSLLYHLNANLSFVAGLGINQIIDVLAEEFGSQAGTTQSGLFIAAGLFINLIFIGLFIIFGYFGKKEHRWLVICGMVYYAFDIVFLVILRM